MDGERGEGGSVAAAGGESPPGPFWLRNQSAAEPVPGGAGAAGKSGAVGPEVEGAVRPEVRVLRGGHGPQPLPVAAAAR